MLRPHAAPKLMCAHRGLVFQLLHILPLEGIFCSCYGIRTRAPRLLAGVLPLHQTDFTKYRPYSLLTLHGFLFQYCPTPTTNIVQMLS